MELTKGFALSVLAILGLLTALLFLPFVTPIVGAALVAYLLLPIQHRLTDRISDGMSAALLVVATTLLFVIPVVLILRIAILEAIEIGTRIEEGEIDLFLIDQWVEELLGRPVDTPGWIDRGESFLIEFLSDEPGGVAGYVTNVVSLLGGVTEFLIGIAVFGLLLYYFLKDGDRFVAWIHSVTPLPEPLRMELHDRVDNLLWAIIVGSVLVSVIQGVLTGIALAISGFSSIVFWTVIAVFFAILPVIGASAIWIPATLYLLATGQFLSALFLGLFGLIVISLSDNLLRGMIGARTAQMNPGLFLLGIFGGVFLFGFIGIFLGPLVVGATKAFTEVFAKAYSPYTGQDGEITGNVNRPPQPQQAS